MWRILVLFLLVLTALYVCLLMYFRTAHRERLIARWASELRVGDRDAFINEEMTGYMKSLKLWLAVCAGMARASLTMVRIVISPRIS